MAARLLLVSMMAIRMSGYAALHFEAAQPPSRTIREMCGRPGWSKLSLRK